MSLKIIINADDFGPIDFINQGIYHHVQQGNLDSAQVLVNMDEQKLLSRLKQLHAYVPKDRTLDLGVHFTLTSGAPISKGNWGKMLKNGDFKAYSHFHFGYADYLDTIEGEFVAQRDRLQRLVDDANTDLGKEKLVFNSVSNHHNIFTIAPDIFETYVRVANGHKVPLKIRSPKARPEKTGNTYYGFVLPLLNLSDSKEQRQLMEKMNEAFASNNYAGGKTIKIKSPSYIDIDFYKNLGSLSQLPVGENKVENRKKKFEDMLKRANDYVTNPTLEPSDKIIEFVFHLGALTPDTSESKYKRMIEGYEGITYKFFDDRQIELLTLDQMSKTYPDLIKTKTSWDECGEVTYRQKN